MMVSKLIDNRDSKNSNALPIEQHDTDFTNLVPPTAEFGVLDATCSTTVALLQALQRLRSNLRTFVELK
jgi:hypothetical protein